MNRFKNNIIAALAVLLCLFIISCNPQETGTSNTNIRGGSYLVNTDSAYKDLPSLIFSRVYFDRNSSDLRILAITNTSEETVNLHDYSLCNKQNDSRMWTKTLPPVKLEKEATLYIINQYYSRPLPSHFNDIQALPRIKAGTVAAGQAARYTDMRLYAGDKTYEIGEHVTKSGSYRSKGYAWHTLDIISIDGYAPTDGTSAVRVYDPVRHLNYGWRTLSQSDRTELNIMDLEDGTRGGRLLSPADPVGTNLPGGKGKCSWQDPGIDEKSKIKENTALGNPILEEGNQLLERAAYTLSFNPDRNLPDWVSWHIDSSDLGRLARPDAFAIDPDLRDDITPVEVTDYHYSSYGFDRGHMCPNGDRTSLDSSQADTFYMTNMVPQAGNNNQGPWVELENAIRSLVYRNGMEIYVVAGPSTENGGKTLEKTDDFNHPGVSIEHIKSRHDDGKTVTIDVPAYTWKVYIAIPAGENDIERIDSAPSIAKVFAVWMPNNDETCPKNSSYNDYKVSIDFVEAMTGLDFFSYLSIETQAELEARNYNPAIEDILLPKAAFIYEEPEWKEAV